MTEVQTFEAPLEAGDKALGWTIVRVPFDPNAVWNGMVRLRVAGRMNGCGFRTSLFPFPGAGAGFYLLVNRALQQDGRARLGQRARFELWPDREDRPAELPDELAVLLQDEPGLRAWYDGLTEYTRREIGKWVAGVKGDEARLRRAEQMTERLLATMEAERELPPILEAAFRRHPKARLGWERLSATHRRAELMALFYYRTPEAQAKRVGKLVEAAEKRAE